MNNDIELLKNADDLYYNSSETILSDDAYDTLKENLRKKFPSDPYFSLIGSKVLNGDYSLPFVLGSLRKVKANGSTIEWLGKENVTNISCSGKIDGASIFVEFNETGVCSQASTRGDGKIGKDITEKIKKICKNIKPIGKKLYTRAEAVMTNEKAVKLGYRNGRNSTAGILNSSSGENIEYISLIFYTVFDTPFQNYSDHIDFLEDLGLDVPPHFLLNAYVDNIEETLKAQFLTLKNSYEYDLDGLVIANDNDSEIGSEYYPENVVAFKVNAEAIPATVKSIEWNVSRLGRINPVIHIVPVDITGSTISKATGFNAKFIEVNTISPGAVVGLIKSGDVIPYIVSCITEGPKNDNLVPSHCPSCGSLLEYSSSGVDLFCNNPECTEKMIYVIENFLLSHECEEVTATTIRNLGVFSIFELFSLTVPDIMKIEGFGESRAETIVTEIRKCLDTTQSNMLKSFGISGIGNTLSKTLTNLFTLEELFTKKAEDFACISGMGDVLSENIVEGLKKNFPLYLFLFTRGLKYKEMASDRFKGKVFCLTGKSDMKRDDLVKFIEGNGGMVKSISKSTNFLVTDDVNSTSGKANKSRQLGVKMISYDELMNM